MTLNKSINVEDDLNKPLRDPFGAGSQARTNSLNRNKFTAHLNTHRGVGSARGKMDDLKS